MTLVTTPSIRERLNHDIFDLFRTSSRKLSTFDFSKKDNHAIDRLTKNKIISVSSVNFMHPDRYEVGFTLTNKFASHFVLLRGLLEFSRPKTIKVTANRADQSFYTEFSESQADDVVSYIETITGWFVKETKFKEAVRALIIFEQKVKREHAMLYAKMKDSV